MDLVHDERLHELRLGNRRGNFEDRLRWEDGSALRNGVHVPGETDLFQMLQETTGEAVQGVEIGQRRGVEPKRFEQ
jgi:hypothetical protein